MGRYLPIRTQLENFFYRYVFLPTAYKNGFIKRSEADLKHNVRTSKNISPLIPLFDWRHKQSLVDDESIRSMLQQLQQESKISMKVLLESLEIDYDYNKEWLEKVSPKKEMTIAEIEAKLGYSIKIVK